MKEQKDIYIKDEGDFYSIFFQSQNAIESAKTSRYADEMEDDKLNILPESLVSIVVWATTFNLTIDSEVPINIK